MLKEEQLTAQATAASSRAAAWAAWEAALVSSHKHPEGFGRPKLDKLWLKARGYLYETASVKSNLGYVLFRKFPEVKQEVKIDINHRLSHVLTYGPNWNRCPIRADKYPALRKAQDLARANRTISVTHFTDLIAISKYPGLARAQGVKAYHPDTVNYFTENPSGSWSDYEEHDPECRKPCTFQGRGRGGDVTVEVADRLDSVTIYRLGDVAAVDICGLLFMYKELGRENELLEE